MWYTANVKCYLKELDAYLGDIESFDLTKNENTIKMKVESTINKFDIDYFIYI